MSDDIIRAKGYAIYRHILKKALVFLMNAVLKATVTSYKNWNATIVLSMHVRDEVITRRVAKITIKESDNKENWVGDLQDDTTVIDRSDLSNVMTSGQFNTIIHSIEKLE